jgi:hypothetical protein
MVLVEPGMDSASFKTGAEWSCTCLLLLCTVSSDIRE